MKFLRQRHHLGAGFIIAPATGAPATGRHLALARGPQLGDQGGFLELRDGTEHLAHQHRSRRVLGEEVWRRGGHETRRLLDSRSLAGQSVGLVQEIKPAAEGLDEALSHDRLA